MDYDETADYIFRVSIQQCCSKHFFVNVSGDAAWIEANRGLLRYCNSNCSSYFSDFVGACSNRLLVLSYRMCGKELSTTYLFPKRY